ncbi:MAG: hypothetical protein EBS07_11415 [Sphingobacteriia bacterium]|nr:hypothetical protein [Sphingobacteriia bacterium]
MKKFIAIPFFLLLMVSLPVITGCNKCKKCKYVYKDNGQEKSIDQDEVCGTQKDIDDTVKSCEEAAKPYNGRCVCVDA